MMKQIACPQMLMLVLLAVGAWGQDEVTFIAGVKVVNLLATVQTKRGDIVRDLSKDDFVLTEKGRRQAIQYFAQESDLPLTLGLMVDTSMSQEKVLDAEKRASFRFLDSVLRENKDKVFVLQFDIAVWVRQGLTSSRRELEDALSLVDTQTREDLQRFGGGTLLCDSVVKAAHDIMRGQQGRKAMIILSDGEDVNSHANLEEAVDAAVRSETLIYAILFASSRSLGTGRGVMQRLARDTGGGFYEVSKKQTIERVYQLIQEELRSQYSIGYVSDEPVKIPEYRRIQLATKDKTLVVRSRDRYWAGR